MFDRLKTLAAKHKLLGWLTWFIAFMLIDTAFRAVWPGQPMFWLISPVSVAIGFVMLLGWQRMGWVN